MTVSNNQIEAIVEIDGIQSYQLQIPAGITSNFLIGEIITGATSGASAEVVQTTTLIDPTVLITNRSGFFEFSEVITSTSGIATTNGSAFSAKSLYNNPTFNIVSGLWTLDTTENQTVKLSGATSTINIYDGGNFSTGNNFTIEVTNFGLTEAFFNDGAFLEGIDVRFFIDLGDGAGSEQRWTGKTKTYTDSGKSTVKLQCVDAGKQRNEKMGSDVVPIALNLNYNCKLPYDSTTETTYKFDDIRKNGEFIDLDYGFITSTTNSAGGAASPTVIVFHDDGNKSDFSGFVDGNFNEGYIKIISGSGSGSIYKIYDVTIVANGTGFSGTTDYSFHVNEDVSDLKTLNQFSVIGINVSVMQIIAQENTYNLSEKPVNKIHKETFDLLSKPPTITDNNLYYEVSDDSYQSDVNNGHQVLKLSGIKENKNTQLISEKVMDVTSSASVANVVLGGIESFYFSASVNIGPLSIIDNLIDTGNDVYLDFKTITLKNALLTTFSDPYIKIGISGFYKDLKFFATDKIDVINPTTIANPILVSIEKSGNDIVVDINIRGNLDAFKFSNYNNSNGLLSNLEVDITVSAVGGIGAFNPAYVGAYELDGVSVLYGGDLSTEQISTGCSGENAYSDFMACIISSDYVKGEIITGATSGSTAVLFSDATTSDVVLKMRDVVGGFVIAETINGSISGVGVSAFVNLPTGDYLDPLDTLRYLMTNYMGVDASNIDEASFAQANSDFDLFSSATTRNACHQIVSQTDVNQVMKDLLFTHHLGLFYGQDGKYTVENWLPKSVVFSDSATLHDFNATEWKSISNIDRSVNTKVISDFQLSFNYNESTGEYNDIIRIKNTSLTSFDFDLCTEGIDISNKGLASEAWDLLSAGYKRINKTSQREEENKWIKKNLNYAADSIQGQGEALAFIRNLSGHINRNLESVTITLPFAKVYLDLDLLSFISVTEAKLTSGKPRTGWIVNRVVDYTQKLVVFKILLDIDLSDPFLVQIGIIQDTFDSPDGINDVSTGTNVITDGRGA